MKLLRRNRAFLMHYIRIASYSRYNEKQRNIYLEARSLSKYGKQYRPSVSLSSCTPPLLYLHVTPYQNFAGHYPASYLINERRKGCTNEPDSHISAINRIPMLSRYISHSVLDTVAVSYRMILNSGSGAVGTRIKRTSAINQTHRS